jgi:hypothetical protein
LFNLSQLALCCGVLFKECSLKRAMMYALWDSSRATGHSLFSGDQRYVQDIDNVKTLSTIHEVLPDSPPHSTTKEGEAS